jgi:hypothetical protein
MELNGANNNLHCVYMPMGVACAEHRRTKHWRFGITPKPFLVTIRFTELAF